MQGRNSAMPYSVKLSAWDEERNFLNSVLESGDIAGYNYSKDDKAVHVTVFFN